MLQFRHLAFGSSVAFLVAAPAAHAAAMPLPRSYTSTIKVVDRLTNPIPSRNVGPGESTQPDEVSPDGPEVMQPDEMPQDGGDAPRPPAVSNDKNNNGQDALPQDQDDGN
ncbi:hypothetical protein LGH82_29350 [Mesorhizobium sp. PAMC28654]|uniref:hypothetical protein n=1 Tax=Mesorhizobium sp. PAMC28654 TaxID=2880934 RepID=UPI001D0A4188|nr:hypothetical protein [Mesorhizobium sp. PAMC28654]UDL89136.1 hypothetical protein LGH82_29350 [Mesorhizobium sp. PAMC28654]